MNRILLSTGSLPGVTGRDLTTESIFFYCRTPLGTIRHKMTRYYDFEQKLRAYISYINTYIDMEHWIGSPNTISSLRCVYGQNCAHYLLLFVEACIGTGTWNSVGYRSLLCR